VAFLDWATWHLKNQPNHDTCQPPIGPRAELYCHINLPCHFPYCPVSLATSIVILPSHLTHKLLTSSRVTFHPSSGDTCHLRIGQYVRPNVQICLLCVTTRGCHITCMDLPCVICTDMPCNLYGPATSASVWTVRTAQSTIFFSLFDFSERMRYLLHTELV
jgi:hypothetical protein